MNYNNFSIKYYYYYLFLNPYNKFFILYLLQFIRLRNGFSFHLIFKRIVIIYIQNLIICLLHNCLRLQLFITIYYMYLIIIYLIYKNDKSLFDAIIYY